MNDPVILIFTALVGLAFGSFLNVLIYRIPRKKSIVSPPSSCPGCANPIKFYDNIPLISYVILKGKCRHCQTKISLIYPLIELLTAFSAVLAVYIFGLTVQGFITVYLSFVFIAVFFIDLEFTIIPDVFTLPGIIIGFAVSFIPGSFVSWSESLIGIAVGGGAFILVGIIGELIFKKEALGFGDVKLAAMFGAFLGWQKLLLILLISSFFGSVIGVIYMYLTSKKGKSSYIPYGPFLVIGAWISIYLGDLIIKSYLQFIGVAP
jgi:leader peptidase (prepilin peptidase)/N-methyltransferase